MYKGLGGPLGSRVEVALRTSLGGDQITRPTGKAGPAGETPVKSAWWIWDPDLCLLWWSTVLANHPWVGYPVEVTLILSSRRLLQESKPTSIIILKYSWQGRWSEWSRDWEHLGDHCRCLRGEAVRWICANEGRAVFVETHDVRFTFRVVHKHISVMEYSCAPYSTVSATDHIPDGGPLKLCCPMMRYPR
jgi:hypothetical protein